MPDLGERVIVMGPQPIAEIVEPPPPMFAAAEILLNALMRGDHATVEAMTPAACARRDGADRERDSARTSMISSR